MQTFLPYKDFDKSAKALDSKRLNKQILECYQILKVLSNPDPRAGWRNHPAVKMWRGFEHLLLDYTMSMVKEANKRGIKTDKNMQNIVDLINTHAIDWGFTIPAWYEDDVKMKRLTITHKANLYKKDPIYYFDFFSALAKSNPCCPNRKEPCKYYWVAHEENYAVA
jgi:hypothetical protein